tara:strand:- start:3947 stop:4825 length:879 start_codon:yes stop_codon:yes gene_type:complete
VISEFAPAKVNLTLRVGAAREDGYHPLDSLVVFADWGDHIAVTAADTLDLEISGEGAETLADEGTNLVLTAARALHKAARLPVFAGAHIHLTKKIPLGSGLGGGSADAAATLRALSRLWHLNWPPGRLAEIGAQIGSDIPACVYSRPLRMTGRGEVIDLLPAWPQLDAVLCLPGVSVSTRTVFAEFDAAAPKALPDADLPSARSMTDALTIVGESANDLEPAAARVAPVIADSLAVLHATDGVQLAGLSGSGATSWAVFDNRVRARAASDALGHAHSAWRFVPVRLGGQGEA